LERGVSDDTKLKAFKAERLKSTMIEKHVSEDEARPKNLKANVLPVDGYGLEVDGRVKSQYETAEAASRAALELKQKYPHIQVMVFGAKERIRTAVELPAPSGEKKQPEAAE
jgi:hypothetical protein